MQIYELLTVNKEFLTRLFRAGVTLDDCQYVELFDTYSTMVQEGEKISYIVAHLAGIYQISERKVYGLIRKFKREVTAR